MGLYNHSKKETRLSGWRTKSVRRQGMAVIELAISLPLLFLFVASFLQLTNTLFLRHKACVAGYIGMQQMAQADATEANVLKTVRNLLSSRGISGASVTLTPTGTLNTAPRGREFKLSISLPIQKNLPAPKVIPTKGSILVEYSVYR